MLGSAWRNERRGKHAAAQGCCYRNNTLLHAFWAGMSGKDLECTSLRALKYIELAITHHGDRVRVRACHIYGGLIFHAGHMVYVLFDDVMDDKGYVGFDVRLCKSET